jgi:hypothetical protein
MRVDLRALLASCLALSVGAIASATPTDPQRGVVPYAQPDVLCGTPARTCPAPAHARATCSAGKCGFVCDSGYTLCGDRCISVRTDPLNCGACGRICPGEDAPSSSYCDQAARRACINGECKKCRWYCGGYGGYYRVCT